MTYEWIELKGNRKLDQISAGFIKRAPPLTEFVVTGDILGVRENRRYRWFPRSETSGWIPEDGLFKQVSVGGDGETWGVSPSGEIFRGIQQVAGSLSEVSVEVTTAVPAIWGVNREDKIWRWPGGPGTANNWVQIDGSLRHIAVGTEIWGVNSEEKIFRWPGGNSTSNIWTLIEGQLVQIAASSQGVCGVNKEGVVYKWRGGSQTGNLWTALAVKNPPFKYVTIGVNENPRHGNILAIDTNGSVFIWDEPSL